MLVVKSTEFRSRIGDYLDKAHEELMVIHKSGDKAYAVIPINEDGAPITPAQTEELIAFAATLEPEKSKKLSIKSKIRNTRKIKVAVDPDEDLYMM